MKNIEWINGKMAKKRIKEPQNLKNGDPKPTWSRQAKSDILYIEMVDKSRGPR